MCVVSMVSDRFDENWRKKYDWYPGNLPPHRDSPLQPRVYPTQPVIPGQLIGIPEVTREEIEEIRKDIAELKDWLKRAKKYDEDNGEPDCEIAEKMDRLRQMAKIVDIDLDDYLK